MMKMLNHSSLCLCWAAGLDEILVLALGVSNGIQVYIQQSGILVFVVLQDF